MKPLKRTFRKHYSTLDRQLQRTIARLSPATALLALETIAVSCALLFLLFGSSAAVLDRFGSRADIAAIAVAAMLIAVLRRFVNGRVLARLDRRFPVRHYDERRILFDLAQAARGAKNINQIYELAVREIAAALRTSNVSIFVRDDVSGDYVCRVSSKESANQHLAERRVAGQLAPHECYVLAGDALIVKRLRGLGAPLGLTPHDLETWKRAVASFDSARKQVRERECLTLRRLDARLLLGITMQQRLVGILSLGVRNGARQYSAEDKRLLLSVASQLAFVIENAKLVERMVAEEGLRRELALAGDVQRRLLPESAPQSASFELSAFCQPARAVGGDYYDFIKLSDDQLAISIADVAGKGISAALLMSSVQASLRSQTMTRCAGTNDMSAPADVVQSMNRLIHASTGAASYVTFFYAQFDERTRALTYVNAGHNPPLLVRTRKASNSGSSEQPRGRVGAQWRSERSEQSSVAVCANGACVAMLEREEIDDESVDDSLERQTEVTELSAGGPVLGIFEDCLYEQETLLMERGDLLVLFTDGLTESLNAVGEEFGEDGLREALANCPRGSAHEVRDAIERSVRKWSAGAAQHDDLTFVVMKVE